MLARNLGQLCIPVQWRLVTAGLVGVRRIQAILIHQLVHLLLEVGTPDGGGAPLLYGGRVGGGRVGTRLASVAGRPETAPSAGRTRRRRKRVLTLRLTLAEVMPDPGAFLRGTG